jgi:hypothetical protein
MGNPYITAALVAGLTLILLLVLQAKQETEGFQDSNFKDRYGKIRESTQKLLPFRDLQRDIRQTLLEGLREAKEPETPEDGLRRIYLENVGGEPLDADCLDLPPWSSDAEDISLALAAIPDTLGSQIEKEMRFYNTKLNELNKIFSDLKDPSSLTPPTEGFVGQGQCSAESSRLAREALRQKRILESRKPLPPLQPANPQACVIRPIQDELTRVERILARINIEKLSGEIRKVATGITKFREDFTKLKEGKLFDWQENAEGTSRKSYATFNGKTNKDGLLFSMKQAGS